MSDISLKTEFIDNENGKAKITVYESKKCQMGVSYNFDVGYAEMYGLNESIMLNNLIFWVRQNMANDRNEHDGYFWTFNTIKAFTKLFPFWTERQIRYILDSLENQKIIKKGNYNKVAYDRTLWYAIIDKSIL